MSGRERIVAGFAAAAAVLLVISGVSYQTTRTQVAAAADVARAHQVQAASYDLRAQLSAAESARRGFVLTGDERFAQAFAAAEAAARRRQQEVAAAATPDRARELARLLGRRLALLRETIALRRARPDALEAQLQRTDEGRQLSEALFRLLDTEEREQAARVAVAEERAQRSARRAVGMIAGGSLVAVLLIAAASLLLLREAARRREAQDALRRSEELNRLVLDRLPKAAVVVFDREMRYLLAGGDSLARTGLSREMLEGHTVREALPTLADQLEPKYRAALAGEESVLDVHYGGRIFVTRAVPIRGPDGAVVAGMVLGLDVTETRENEALILRLNEDLEQSVTELTQANQELEAFSYSVSHDLRAPLRHISGFVDLLRRGSRERLDETGQRQLDTIVRAARNMGQLIDDLLAFSKVSRTKPHREAVDMGFLVREVVQPIRLETADRALEWVIGDLPRVTADPALMRIVLTNLVGNAVKYSRTREHARIEIGALASATPAEGGAGANGQAVLFVRDNGVGFDMEYAGKLFGVFQRLHRAEEFEGTGIGLATVRRIVHRHGGQTWASGQVGEGATFYFSLPLAGDPAPAAAGTDVKRSA
jgi:signal transduction histidine kinase/CHASE3 domain sensor protein